MYLIARNYYCHYYSPRNVHKKILILFNNTNFSKPLRCLLLILLLYFNNFLAVPKGFDLLSYAPLFSDFLPLSPLFTDNDGCTEVPYPSPKIVINFPLTYQKLQCKGNYVISVLLFVEILSNRHTRTHGLLYMDSHLKCKWHVKINSYYIFTLIM